MHQLPERGNRASREVAKKKNKTKPSNWRNKEILKSIYNKGLIYYQTNIRSQMDVTLNNLV